MKLDALQVGYLTHMLDNTEIFAHKQLYVVIVSLPEQVTSMSWQAVVVAAPVKSHSASLFSEPEQDTPVTAAPLPLLGKVLIREG